MMEDIDSLNLKLLLENANIGIVIHRWDTSIIYANPTALKLLRLSYEQIIGKDALDSQWCFLDEAGIKLMQEDYPVNKVKRTKGRLSNEVIGVIDSTSDEINWFMINAYFEGVPESENSFIVVTFTDISDSKQLFLLQDIVENTQDIVIVTEAQNIESPSGPRIVYVNKAFEDLTGYKQEEVIGETPRILQGALTDHEAKDRIHAALKNQEAVTETLLNYDIKGRPYWIEMNIIPLKNKYGEVTHFAAIERDVSERKFHLEQLEKRNKDLKILKRDLERIVDERTAELQRAKAKLEKLAYFDPLTNIPNRRFFIDQTSRLIRSCQRRNKKIAFGILDIDNFKSLNDLHGHDVGDHVLKALADFFKQIFRPDDAFCRYGGEEFAFAIAVTSVSGLESLAARLITGIQALEIDCESSERLNVTASIGFKLCNNLDRNDIDKEMKQADNALYQSKQNGKNQFTILPP